MRTYYFMILFSLKFQQTETMQVLLPMPGNDFPMQNNVLLGFELNWAHTNVYQRNLAFDWLDWTLKDAPKPELLKDKVNFQVMGTNSWRHEPTMESMSNENLRYYFDREMLVDSRPEVESFQSQLVDFSDREDMNNYFHPSLIIDSLNASNGTVFMSELFENDFMINGAFTGELAVEINKHDMDLSISFYELMADGRYFQLSRYLGRITQTNQAFSD